MMSALKAPMAAPRIRRGEVAREAEGARGGGSTSRLPSEPRRGRRAEQFLLNCISLMGEVL
jgi:hypothetical protein